MQKQTITRKRTSSGCDALFLFFSRSFKRNKKIHSDTFSATDMNNAAEMDQRGVYGNLGAIFLRSWTIKGHINMHGML